MRSLLLVVGLLQLLFGVESSWFKKDDDYIRRVRCMYAFNSSTPQKDPKHVDNVAVIYYQLDGTNDTVHYVWSFAGAPTLYMSVTEVADSESCSESANKLFKSWDEFIHNQAIDSVDMPGFGEDFYFSLVFNRLIEFRDKSNKASKSFNANDLANNKTYRPVALSGLDWTFDGERMKLVAHDSTYNSSRKHQFSWAVQLYVPTKPGRLSRFPKTLHYENSTVFDFVFNDFNYSKNFIGKEGIKYGRLVLEMQLVHGMLKNNSKVEKVFSRDDEYTPSVFLTYNQRFGGGDALEGYLQWKPISYLSSKRKSTQSQQANTKNGESILLSNVSLGLVTALYANDTEAGVIQPVYMIFGTEGDDNNPNPEYVSWTGMLGFGERPQDTISLVVIITICVGLGVPTLLIGLGGVFLVLRRKPWKKITDRSKRNGGYTKLDINDNHSK